MERARRVGSICACACTCALLLLAACHGRPLRSQVARDRLQPAGTQRPAPEAYGMSDSPVARRLLPLDPPHPFVLTERELEILHRARALRQPGNWPQGRPCPTALGQAEALARMAASEDNPAKATRPGSAGLDVGNAVSGLLELLKR